MFQILILQSVKAFLESLSLDNYTKESECFTLYIKSLENISEVRMIDTTVEPGIVVKTFKDDDIQFLNELDEDDLPVLNFMIKIIEEKENYLKDKYELNIYNDKNLIGIVSDFTFYEKDSRIKSVNICPQKMVLDEEKSVLICNQPPKNFKKDVFDNNLVDLPDDIIKNFKNQMVNAKQFVNSILRLENKIDSLLKKQAAYNKEIYEIDKKIDENLIFNKKETLSEYDKKALELQKVDLFDKKEDYQQFKIINEATIDEQIEKKKILYEQFFNIFEDHREKILNLSKNANYTKDVQYNDHINKDPEQKSLKKEGKKKHLKNMIFILMVGTMLCLSTLVVLVFYLKHNK